MVTTLTKHYEARTCADLLARLDELENLPSNTPTMPPLFAIAPHSTNDIIASISIKARSKEPKDRTSWA